MQYLMFHPTEAEEVERLSLPDKIVRAKTLLLQNQPVDGYYLAFSGGKDSVVCKALAEMAEVKFEAHYHNTTIDPPEVVWFIKKFHPEVVWDKPRFGNMMRRLIECPHMPPTRKHRWCCEEFKENNASAKGRTIVFGVRAEESHARKRRYSEITEQTTGDLAICPILHWKETDVWEFIHLNHLPYCSLYDEGWDRVGCVGCPLVNKEKQDREFARWPKYEENWKRAIIEHWNLWKDKPNTRTGKPRYEARFKTGEDLWEWWRTERVPDYFRGSCQSEFLWSNVAGSDDDELEMP